MPIADGKFWNSAAEASHIECGTWHWSASGQCGLGQPPRVRDLVLLCVGTARLRPAASSAGPVEMDVNHTTRLLFPRLVFIGESNLVVAF